MSVNAMSSIIGQEAGERCGKAVLFRSAMSNIVFVIFYAVTRALVWMMGKLLSNSKSIKRATVTDPVDDVQSPKTFVDPNENEMDTIDEYGETDDGSDSSDDNGETDDGSDSSDDNVQMITKSPYMYNSVEIDDTNFTIEEILGDEPPGDRKIPRTVARFEMQRGLQHAYVWMNIYGLAFSTLSISVIVSFDMPFQIAVTGMSLIFGSNERMKGGIVWKVASAMSAIACIFVFVGSVINDSDYWDHVMGFFRSIDGTIGFIFYVLICGTLWPIATVSVLHNIRGPFDIVNSLESVMPINGALCIFTILVLYMDNDRCLAKQGIIMADLVIGGTGTEHEMSIQDAWDTLNLLTMIPLVSVMCIFCILSAVLNHRSSEAGVSLIFAMCLRNIVTVHGYPTPWEATGFAMSSIALVLITTSILTNRLKNLCHVV